MPCTFTSIELRERERERDRERERARAAADAKKREEERKRKVQAKKRALFVALAALGFTISSSEKIDGNNIHIVATREKK